MNDKYESIILVVNRAELSMALDLYNKLTHIGKRTLILTKNDIIASDKKLSIRSFQFYRTLFQFTYSSLTREAYNLFSSLAEEEVNKELTLRELTMYKGVSLWELSAQHVLSKFLPILHDFNILEAALNFERPCEVYVINGVSSLEKILELICKKRQISFFIHNSAVREALSLNKSFWKIVILAKKIKRLLVNLRFLFINLIKSRNLNKKYKIVFFASVGRYLASILPVIFKYSNEERLAINMFSSSTKKLKELEMPYMDFYGYKLHGLFNKDTRNLLRKIRDAINENSSFYTKLLYKEATIGPILRNLFEELIYEVFPHNMQRIDIIRKIILSHRPEVIVVLNSPNDIVLTAKTLSTPVVVIQSGFVVEFYYYGPTVADAITVNGSYWKEYLLKGRDDVIPGKILVTGPTKFDFMLNNDSYIKDSINFDNRCKKIVVFATNCLLNLSLETLAHERIEQFSSVCKAIKNIKEARLIIKLHPYEKDLNIYKKIIQETGLANYSIVKNIEMLKLLHNCDLLITLTSTAAYEAVLLDKNVVSLFGSSKFEPEDIWDFKKYDATIVVDNLGELEKCIRSALFDPETISRLKRGREVYIYEHAYKLDGNASGRVREVIDRFIRT